MLTFTTNHNPKKPRSETLCVLWRLDQFPLKTVSFKWICSSSDWWKKKWGNTHPNHFTCILTGSGPQVHREVCRKNVEALVEHQSWKNPEGWSPLEVGGDTEKHGKSSWKTWHIIVKHTMPGELKASSFRFVGLENFTMAACWEIFVFWNVTECVRKGLSFGLWFLQKSSKCGHIPSIHWEVNHT